MSDNVLIVEDDPMQQRMLATFLRTKLNLTAQCAGNGREALKTLEDAQDIKLIILDLDMPVLGGMDTLDILQKRFPHLPVIMLTGSADVQDAIDALKHGAVDFITKPYDPPRLIATIKNALKLSLLSKEVKRLTIEKNGTCSFTDLIGHDGGLASAVQIGQKAAQTDISVLITGETGVGKELFARALHGESLRSDKPFIAVNCGALPEQLIESILFGHEKGAFTGATEKTIGKFREADGGTIFLDEVGELPLEAQVKLLRVLQQQEVEPVGAARPISVNVRILSATNRTLEAQIKEGHFREDLYFRLNVLEIDVPPLRTRSHDIPLLMRHFIDRFSARYNKISAPTLSPASERYLMQYTWPGNVRELENAINRAIVIDDDDILDNDDFSKIVDTNTPLTHKLTVNHQTQYSVFDQHGVPKPMHVIEQEVIALALKYCENNVTHAAKTLGMAKSTLYRKIQ